MRKKIMITGCSYSAPSTLPEYAGTSWGEQLAKKLDWDLVHLARQGMSNGGIRVMIDEILRQKPDFAIIAPTFHDRTEIPASAAPYDWSIAPTSWNTPLQQHLQNNDLKNGYVPEYGVQNINLSKDTPYTMISETIFSLAENYDHAYRSTRIDKNTQNAMKQWVNFLYDSNWKLQMDRWIISDGIFRLHHAGIPFLLVACNIWTSNDVREAFPEIIPDKCLTLKYEDTSAYSTNEWPFDKNDPGYHGSVQSQTYVADRYYDLIKNEWKL
jgi:hypothetical protein